MIYNHTSTKQETFPFARSLSAKNNGTSRAKDRTAPGLQFPHQPVSDLQPQPPVDLNMLYNALCSIQRWKHRPSSATARFLADNSVVMDTFMRCREYFRAKNKPVVARVGFHYTHPNNIENIRNLGLLPNGGFDKTPHGANYGRGVYVSDNPHAFCHFGKTGIVLLYLSGTEKQLHHHISRYSVTDSRKGIASDCDTVRGNKLTKAGYTEADKKVRMTQIPKSPYFEEIILQKSAQVLPILAYSRSAVNDAESMYQFKVELQELVDRTLNYPEDYAPVDQSALSQSPRKTLVPRVYPDYDDLRLEHILRVRMKLDNWLCGDARYRFDANGRFFLK
eukprot:jgi/Psemu1/293031/fgenesh1_pg.1550_\